MAILTWITPAGTIANLGIGMPENIAVLATDTTNNGATLTYQIVGGELPPGMTMSTTGIISGTPEYSTPSNNYFTTLNYDFLVRVSTTNNLLPQDRSFRLILTNTVNSDFSWITPAGSLGTVPNGEFYQLPLQVTAHGATFKFISGELPPGMQVVSSTGLLQGVPTLDIGITTGTSKNYRFTIRATNSQGHVRDQAFNLSITNVFGPVIEPAVTNLGSFFDGSYYSQQLTVNEPSSNAVVTWSNIGKLPPGVTLSSTGTLSGWILPIAEVGNFGPSGYDGDTYTGPTVTAGSFVSGQDYIIASPGTTDFTLIGAQNNRIGTEFTAIDAGYGTGTAYIARLTTVTASQKTDVGPYDFGQTKYQSLSYSFSVRAFDGANYDLQNYILTVMSRAGFTADSTNIHSDDTIFTIDTASVYPPVLLNASQTLPTARAGSYYAFKLDGFDFQGDPVIYSLSDIGGTFDSYVLGSDAGFDYGGTGVSGGPEVPPTPTTAGRGGVGFDSGGAGNATINLPGLLLDASSGWIYGRLTPQNTSYQTYSFAIIVSKIRDGVVYAAQPVYFTLPVLGDVNNVINWVTPPDLGTIDNGSVSELVLEAKNIEDKPLVYKLYDKAGVPIRLPQGLELVSTKQNNQYLGLLSGRVTFEAFSVDDYATTFDGNKMTVDRVYKFTVEVSVDDAVYNADGTLQTPPSAFEIREFTLRLNIIDKEPYDNLYLQAQPAWDQRQIFNSVINNTEIFVPELIYRPTDPWFGVANKIKMLFLAGLQPDDLNTYVEAMMKNHYTKTYSFGDISTAVVLDSNYNIKYEVVYINVVDPEELTQVDSRVGRKGPPQKLDLTNAIANPYVDAAGNDYKIVYPNSSENMALDLTQNIGYYDQSSLPPWMTSNQPNPANPNKFNTPIGFTKAVVLAYTIPGASKLIAYRLRNSGINFNNIDFTVDRYTVDDVYTKNFNTTNKVYNTGAETTFDALPNKNIGSIVASVTYAVNVAFDQINGRTVGYILNQGGLDGLKTFNSGDTLIFVKQENFSGESSSDGWVNYTDGYISDNITTVAHEGYASMPFDKYTIIPGYLEKQTGGSPVNQRGGVWQINIVNDIVSLIPILEILPNDRVRILQGKTYGSAIVYYNQTLDIGQTVPKYSVYKVTDTIGHRTTFNANTTKFFSGRDTYYEPGNGEHYLKFPQYGMFN